MECYSDAGKEKIERELSRLIGYRLLGWSIISLWAVAVITLFRVFRDYPQTIETALLWIAPVLAGRALGCAVLHKQLRAAVNMPAFATIRRYSIVSGLCDGVILLSACVLAHAAGLVSPPALTVFAMASLASLSMVYMFTPRVTVIIMLQVALPAVALVYYFGVALPVEFLLLAAVVLVGTALGVNQFKSLYLGQLRAKFDYEQELFRAAESNFIFNQHWQKMQLAAIDWDRDCVIKSWNPAAEALFGVSAASAQGQSLELLFERETAAEIRSLWLNGAVPGGAALRELSVRGHAIATLWYDTPLFHDGELIGIASFVANASDQAFTRLSPLGMGAARIQGAPVKAPPASAAAVSAGAQGLVTEHWSSQAVV